MYRQREVGASLLAMAECQAPIMPDVPTLSRAGSLALSKVPLPRAVYTRNCLSNPFSCSLSSLSRTLATLDCSAATAVLWDKPAAWVTF